MAHSEKNSLRDAIRISAVIPTYNRENTIVRAIESALGQEHPPTEVVVVDDGSSDNTRRIVEAYGDKVRYLYQTNAGVSAARNRGVEAAKCEWIAFLDSDDYWLPTHLQVMAKAIDATGGEAALYFSDIVCPGDDDEGRLHWDTCGLRINGGYELKTDATDWAMMRLQPMMLQSSVIHRDAYIKTGGLPQVMVTREDTLLFHKLCLLYPVCAVSGCGTIMTSEGGRGGRLTVRFDGQTVEFWTCTVTLFKELLACADKLSEAHKRVIFRQLIESYLRLSHVSLKKRKFFGAFASLSGAVMTNPVVSVKVLSLKLATYFAKRIRAQSAAVTRDQVGPLGE